MKTTIVSLAKRAKLASVLTAVLSADQKKKTLLQTAKNLMQDQSKILRANAQDVAAARKNKLSAAMIDRLTLTPARLESMAASLKEIAAWKDPIGQVLETRKTQGFTLQKVRVPLGVVAMVYESRPNVTIEAGALCFKSGNAVILRGGKEAIRSNKALVDAFKRALKANKISSDAVTFIEDLNRENIYELASLDGIINLMIARGSEKMVQDIRSKALVPVLGHGKGLCHVYIDSAADLQMALDIAYNAKVQRPGVCNAMETLLVHQKIAKQFLPQIAQRYAQVGVTIYADPKACALVSNAKAATEQTWHTEYSDLILSIKVVSSFDEALEHIQTYSSGHTDTIVTNDKKAAQKFLKMVDSAAVFWNVSTRMHDGGVFGLGAEIGISTQKLHARGAMGAFELTSTKYIGSGSGQIRK